MLVKLEPKIVYEDADVIVIYKPAGLATQTKKASLMDVESYLRKYLKGEKVYVIHRLDQPVEGLLVFAKNGKAAAKLSAQVGAKNTEESNFSKDYLALVYGKINENKGHLENYLIKNSNLIAQVVEASELDKNPDAKKAILDFELIKTNDEISLVRVHLRTGRFHQIRVQLAGAGYPILGDQKYGTKDSLDYSATVGIKNVALCADQLSFIHPVTNKRLDFTCEPDFLKDFL